MDRLRHFYPHIGATLFGYKDLLAEKAQREIGDLIFDYIKNNLPLEQQEPLIRRLLEMNELALKSELIVKEQLPGNIYTQEAVRRRLRIIRHVQECLNDIIVTREMQKCPLYEKGIGSIIRGYYAE